MALVLNVTAQTNVTNGAVKMILANEQGEVVAAGRSWGRKGPGDSEEPRQLAFDRLLNQLVKLGVAAEELKAATFNVTETKVESATAGQPKTKVSISLAGLMSGEVKVEPKAKKAPAIPVNKPEGNVTAANVATKTDCGLITPATNRPAFIASAVTAIQTVSDINEALAEEGFEVVGQRADVNRLMESGTTGAPAIGAFRQDSNGAPMIQQVRSEVVDPSVRPFEAREQTSLPSINARHGVEGLVSGGIAPSRAPVTVSPGKWLADKATSKRKAGGFQKAEREDANAAAKALGSFYGKNIVEALGGGIDADAVVRGFAISKDLRAKDVESRAKIEEFNRLAVLEGRKTIWIDNQSSDNSKAYQLGYTVGMLRQGLSDSKVSGSAGFNGAHKPGYLDLLAKIGLVVRVHNGAVLLNDRPITWDADFMAGNAELFSSADRAVNG